MPKAVRWLADAWTQLQQLPEGLHAEALTLAGTLMGDPFPAGSEPYEPVPDTYRLRSGRVSLHYRVIGDEIDIVLVWPNT